MNYTTQMKYKTTDYLEDEEFEVAYTMKRAGYKLVEEDYGMFTPTYVLFKAYRTHLKSIKNRVTERGMPDDLTIRQFGAALNQVFDLEYCKTRRRIDGVRVYGYTRIIGEGSIKVREC